MARYVKKISRKAGLPPGTLVHIGEKKTEMPRIRVIDFDEEHFEERELATFDECLRYKDKPTSTWISIEGIHQTEIIEKIGQCFNLHPLALEDILNTDQRPKLDDYEGYICVILKTLGYDEKTEQLKTEQLSLILGSTYVISFQESQENTLESVRGRLRKGMGRIRKLGPDYLAYALLDAIVDQYFLVLEKMGERIEALEENLMSDASPETAKAIHHLKRNLILLRKSVWPVREVISRLEVGESSLIEDRTRLFFRDVYDHAVHVIDTIETFRDMASGMIDVYLSSTSNKLNEVMKVLTIIATIFIPMTFFVGVYGMNFKYMPELEWPWAYPMLWLFMIALGLSMLAYFRKKKWL
jgi:magnesium transporter